MKEDSFARDCRPEPITPIKTKFPTDKTKIRIILLLFKFTLLYALLPLKILSVLICSLFINISLKSNLFFIKVYLNLLFLNILFQNQD